jgi:hypothetical protein
MQPIEYSPTSLRLFTVDGMFAVCKMPADAPIPHWATDGKLVSITRTADELSIVCRQDHVPDDIHYERDWRCLRIAGAMPFTVVGVLASLAAPLASAGIGIFAISTFDTDYLLTKAADFERAISALRKSGHVVNLDEMQ